MHATEIRVRFDEVDQGSVVHHPRYLVYFEVARTKYLADLGIPYSSVMKAGAHLAVTELSVRYFKPARYEDVLTVLTRCTEASGARVTLVYEVRRGDDLLATGTTRLGAIDAAGRARRMPDDLRGVFEAAAREAPAP